VKFTSLIGFVAALLLALTLCLCARASNQTSMEILHSFGDGSVVQDGLIPAKLILGTDGNYYGITCVGGSGTIMQELLRYIPNGDVEIISSMPGGTVFRMTPSGHVSIMHNFGDPTVLNDGGDPWDLIEGKDGNLYGVTYGGGMEDAGVIFQITMASPSQYKILHDFGDGSVPNDGQIPTRIVQGIGGDNNFYVVTWNGGSAGLGTVLTIESTGMKILHSFGDGSVKYDGENPRYCIVGTDGNLYGTTQFGGTTGSGTLFQMTTAGSETILHNFLTGTPAGDGKTPVYLVQDGSVFYGDTLLGGAGGKGALYSYTAGNYSVVHSFGDGTVVNDGNWPDNLAIGADGNIYGFTRYGGATVAADPGRLGFGTLFRISPAGKETILRSLSDGAVANDGRYPQTFVMQTATNTIYGVTMEGGSTTGPYSGLDYGGYGTAYKLPLFGGSMYVLWNKSGQVSLWKIPATGATSSATFGPYSGWTPIALSSDANGNAYILWNSTTGATSVWEVSPSLSVTISQVFGPFSGWVAKSIAVGPDGHVHVLWNQTANNEISIFNITLGQSFVQQVCQHYAGWQANKVATDSNNDTWVLWQSTPVTDTAVLWNITSGGVLNSYVLGPFAGWQPQDLAIGPDNVARVLWVNTKTKQASVYSVPTRGSITSQAFGPYTGWTPADLAVNIDGDSFLMWNNTSNQTSLFDIATAGSFTSSAYGPYSGWQAIALAPGP